MNQDYNFSFEVEGGETVRVDAAPSMVFPQLCTFTISRPIYSGLSAHFAEPGQSKGSPMVDKLFGLEFITEVLAADNVLTITVKEETKWEDAIPKIGAAVRDVLVSGEESISDEVTKAMLPSEEIQRRVQKVLDESINPQISSHGGFVNLANVANNAVYLEFAGGCHGCGMANVTLKYGVERILREAIPGMGEIRDTTDHASGQNPYHGPAGA
jgi:Fe-S cluster biogenesis protein NfuA